MKMEHIMATVALGLAGILVAGILRCGHGQGHEGRIMRNPMDAPAPDWNAVPEIWAPCERCGKRHAPAMVTTNAPGDEMGCP
jgi:hypothetical protein